MFWSFVGVLVITVVVFFGVYGVARVTLGN